MLKKIILLFIYLSHVDATQTHDQNISAVVGANVTLLNITADLSKITLECFEEKNKTFFLFRDNKFIEDSALKEYPVETPPPDKDYVAVVLLNVTTNHRGPWKCEQFTTHEDRSETLKVFNFNLNVSDNNIQAVPGDSNHSSDTSGTLITCNKSGSNRSLVIRDGKLISNNFLSKNRLNLTNNSVVMKNVTENDTGLYICEVKVKRVNGSISEHTYQINVTVSEDSSLSSTISPDVTPNVTEPKVKDGEGQTKNRGSGGKIVFNPLILIGIFLSLFLIVVAFILVHHKTCSCTDSWCALPRDEGNPAPVRYTGPREQNGSSGQMQEPTVTFDFENEE